MTSYYNYSGVKPGSRIYKEIAEVNICKMLAEAFEVDDLSDADLARSAEDYLGRIGLSDETIADLREKLSRNY